MNKVIRLEQHIKKQEGERRSRIFSAESARIQLISIVIFNPRLLDTYPTTKEQLVLLNNFCKLLKYKVNKN